MLALFASDCGWPPPSARAQNSPFPIEPKTTYRAVAAPDRSRECFSAKRQARPLIAFGVVDPDVLTPAIPDRQREALAVGRQTWQ